MRCDGFNAFSYSTGRLEDDSSDDGEEEADELRRSTTTREANLSEENSKIHRPLGKEEMICQVVTLEQHQCRKEL
jgi:hypothetical protein